MPSGYSLRVPYHLLTAAALVFTPAAPAAPVDVHLPIPVNAQAPKPTKWFLLTPQRALVQPPTVAPGAVSATATGPWEAIGSVAATGTGPWESLALTPTGDVNLVVPLNAQAPKPLRWYLLTRPQTRIEPVGPVSVSASRTAPWESLGIPFNPALFPRPTGTVRGGQLVYSYLRPGAGPHTQQLPVAVAATRAGVWESLGRIAATRQSPWEGLIGVRRTLSAPWESGGLLLVTRTAVGPWEALGRVQATVSGPWEAGASLLALRSGSWEALRSVLRTSANPWEALRIVLRSATGPWETEGILVIPPPLVLDVAEFLAQPRIIILTLDPTTVLIAQADGRVIQLRVELPVAEMVGTVSAVISTAGEG